MPVIVLNMKILNFDILISWGSECKVSCNFKILYIIDSKIPKFEMPSRGRLIFFRAVSATQESSEGDGVEDLKLAWW